MGVWRRGVEIGRKKSRGIGGSKNRRRRINNERKMRGN